jgi:Arc/MetJ-type ribon-helix-helix transcriptional regulator
MRKGGESLRKREVSFTQSELAQIQDLIDAGVYLNASDFVKEAIRDKLTAIKVIKCRDVDYETAKKGDHRILPEKS